MKDFFKKLTKNHNEVDDLDAGYDSEYYQGSYDRTDRYDERYDRRDEGYDRQDRYDDRYDRDNRDDRDDRYDRRDEGYDRQDRYDDRYDRRAWQEQDAPSYRERPEVKPEPVFEPAPAPEYLYFKPSTYRDCREGIVRGLAAGHVVVVRLGNMEANDVLRLFDYMMGAVLALEGELVRPAATTVVLLPKGAELDEDELEPDDEDDDEYEEDEESEEYEEEYEDEDEESEEYEEEYEDEESEQDAE